MFRIETFCDDKNLPRVLHALTGLVIGQPNIQPVANAHAKDGKVKAKVNGNLPSLFMSFVKERRLKEVRAVHVKEFAVKHGYAETSYSLILQKLLGGKLVRKKPNTKGTNSVYVIAAEAK